MKIDKTQIILRKATLSDIDILIENRILFLNEVQGFTSIETESLLRASLKQYLHTTFYDDSFVSWIAEYGNKPVGFSGMVIREQPGTYSRPNGRTGYILNMFTLKEYRKNGICSLLLQKLIEEAKERQLDQVELYATKEGEPLYRQFGFYDIHDKAMELTLL
jgi:GNAT superfamily N-acetyltransferase